MIYIKGYLVSVFTILMVTLCNMASLYFAQPITGASLVANIAISMVLMVGFLGSCISAYRLYRDLPPIGVQNTGIDIDVPFIRSTLLNFTTVLFMLTVFDYLSMWGPNR